MASETNELTFVRCPSCRSLVPATASRCRICNNPLEGADGLGKAGESDAAKAASRVRQKTISATPEDVASALKQSTESRGNAPASQQPPQVAAVAQPQAVAADDGDFDPLSAYLEELEDDSAPIVAASGAVEAPHAAQASVAAPEPDDDFGFDIFDELDLETESQQKLAQAQPAPSQSAATATPDDDFDFLAELDDSFGGDAPEVKPVRAATPPPASPKPVAVAPESVPVSAAPAARGAEARRDESRREPPRPPAVQQSTKRDQNQRLQNNDRQPEKQQQRDAVQQSKRDGRDQNQQQQQQSHRHQHQQNQQQHHAKPQGQRGGERAHDERRGDDRRSHESPRHQERKHEERRGEERRRDDRREDRRNDDHRQHSGAALSGGAEQVATAGPKTGKMRPGRLFGWFVSYENPDGRAIELREGKFFVTGSSIRATDLILEDPSISTPHALMAVSAEGGLVVQDLMSDRGVFVRSSGGGGYRREEGTVHVAHGDWIRFGDVEFLVIVVPQGTTR